MIQQIVGIRFGAVPGDAVAAGQNIGSGRAFVMLLTVIANAVVASLATSWPPAGASYRCLRWSTMERCAGMSQPRACSTGSAKLVARRCSGRLTPSQGGSLFVLALWTSQRASKLLPLFGQLSWPITTPRNPGCKITSATPPNPNLAEAKAESSRAGPGESPDGGSGNGSSDGSAD